jgi:hypothetical protein
LRGEVTSPECILISNKFLIESRKEDKDVNAVEEWIVNYFVDDAAPSSLENWVNNEGKYRFRRPMWKTARHSFILTLFQVQRTAHFVCEFYSPLKRHSEPSAISLPSRLMHCVVRVSVVVGPKLLTKARTPT